MFPSGHVIGTPRSRTGIGHMSRHSTMKSKSSLNGHNNDINGDIEQTSISLPRLDPRNNLNISKKRTNCAFVANQKVYLRMKGYNINDVYSLKRHRRSIPIIPEQTFNKHNVSLDLNLLPVLNKELHKTGSKTHHGPYYQKENAADFWKPHDSRRTDERGWQTLYSILNSCKEALQSTDRATPRANNGSRPPPGTSRKMSRDTLHEGNTAFYKDASGFISPVTGRHSNIF